MATALPVLLSSFSVSKRQDLDRNIAEINWSTELETESSHFEVQRSADLTNWVKIASVKSTGSTNQTYSATDEHPKNSVNYYRLKMVDLDGTFAFSRIV